MNCPLCCPESEHVLWSDEQLRIIAVYDETHAAAFCRVIWHDHIAEMTDLSPQQRTTLMNRVWQVEEAMRQVLNPVKINLASLGNMVPHLHWHIIARFQNDACFPAPIWANAVRSSGAVLPNNWVEQVRDILNNHHKET